MFRLNKYTRHSRVRFIKARLLFYFNGGLSFYLDIPHQPLVYPPQNITQQEPVQQPQQVVHIDQQTSDVTIHNM